MITLWLSIFVFFAASCFAIVWPFVRNKEARSIKSTSTHTLKTALDAIERDLSTDIIDAASANTAKAEIARRYMAQKDSKSDCQISARSAKYTTIIAAAAISVLCIGTASLYAFKGSPELPDLPLSEQIRRNADTARFHHVKRMERYLNTEPEDAKGWALIAPVYREEGQLENASRAYQNALKWGEFTDKETSHLIARYAEARLSQTAGNFTLELHQLVDESYRLDSSNTEAAFLYGLSLEKSDKQEAALKHWKRVAGSFRDEPALASQAVQRIQALTNTHPMVAPNATPDMVSDHPPIQRGPTQEDVAAAMQLSTNDRQSMIQGMVDGLALKLEDNPNDIQGWERLINAYVVLKQTEKASQSLAKANTFFTNKPSELGRLSNLAKRLNLEP